MGQAILLFGLLGLPLLALPVQGVAIGSEFGMAGGERAPAADAREATSCCSASHRRRDSAKLLC